MTSAAPQFDDGVLLQRWVSAGDQGAFAALVTRYADLVYSAALRQVRRADAAEEVAQAVFLVLARKAKSISPQRPIAAWLFKAVRYAAGDWNKREARRQRREKEAARVAQQTGMAVTHPCETSDDWNTIAPVLDDAIQQLNAKLRDVILLRFFQGKTHQEIAHVLGISEIAARQRLSRSLEQMRRFFLQRGIRVTSSAIAVLIPLHAVTPAPSAVIASCTSGALAAVPAAGIAKGILIMMTISKIKVSAFCLLLAIFLACVTLVVTKTVRRDRSALVLPISVSPSLSVVDNSSGNIAGVVRGIDGKPLANAEVYVQGNDEPTYIDHTPPFLHPPRKITGDDGHFSTKKPGGDFYLAVRHEQGVAWVRGSASQSTYDIVLRPWGRIEGTFRAGPQTKADVPIHIEMVRQADDPMIVLYDSQVKTAADGTFAFPRVPPGQAIVCRAIDAEAGQYTELTRISVLPGKATVVAVGGNGCAVTGTGVGLSAAGQPLTAPGLRASVSLRNLSGPDVGAVFYGTIDSNGKFRVDDVPAGTYQLTLSYSKPKAGGRLSDRTEVAVAHKPLTVPGGTATALEAGLVQAISGN